MDVRCTKCGIEYEFDDAKVTAAGVTVKCTSCGHVFKVKREEPAMVPGSPSTSFGSTSLPPATANKDGTEWMVKRVDGQVFRFKELTTLQKWIVERKVGRDDEISKTGKTWKKLGEIAELASFFQVVDAANQAVHQASLPPSPPPAMPTVTTLPPAGPASGTGFPAGPSTMPPIPLTSPTHQPGAGPSALGVVPPSTSLPPALSQTAAAADATPMAVTPPTVPIRREVRPTGDVDLAELDDDDPVLQMIKRRRRNAALAVLFVVVTTVGGGAYAFWPELSTALGIAKPAVVAHPAVNDAMQAVQADALDGLQTARTALDAPKDPLESAAQARVDVAIASHLRAQARALDALADAAAKTKREEAGAALAKAYGTLTSLRASAPSVDTHLASAAYQLEKGALAEQRADLEAARSAARAPDADAARVAAVDAEIAVQQALADAEAGLASDAATALAKLPASEDGRLRSARAALAVAAIKTAVDVDVARSIVEGLPAKDERRTLWLKVIDARAALKPATPVVVDAGVAAAANDAGSASASASADAGAAASEEPIESLSYEQVMQKAERARVNERSKAAYDLFAKAAKMKPSARPWLGVGWAALDLGRNTESVRAFQKALSYDENLADAQFGLAEALKISGRNDEAKTAYEDYLKMDPNGRDAAIAKRALESLQ